MKMVSNIRVWILKLYDAGSFTVIGAEGEFGVSSSIPVQFGFVKFELMKKKAWINLLLAMGLIISNLFQILSVFPYL